MAMAKFIEVHSIDNYVSLVNLDWIEEIRDRSDGSTIFLAFNSPFANSQDYIDCSESYEEIKKLIQEELQ